MLHDDEVIPKYASQIVIGRVKGQTPKLEYELRRCLGREIEEAPGFPNNEINIDARGKVEEKKPSHGVNIERLGLFYPSISVTIAISTMRSHFMVTPMYCTG